jgi:hypothetical protein
MRGYPDDDLRRAVLAFWCAALVLLAAAAGLLFVLTYPFLPRR